MQNNDMYTASRAALDAGFARNRQLLDWMNVPGMATYVNSMVSGKSPNDGGHWALYAAEKHIIPLSKKLGRPLRMVSLGCGASRIEEGLIARHGWPVSEYVGMEYDSALRDAGATKFAALPGVTAEMQFLDFNDTASAPKRTFDVVFCHHAIHHATDVEGLLRYVNSMLEPDSLFVGSEFFGPTRFQVEYEHRQIIDRLDAMLPPDLKINLRTNKLEPVRYATLASMAYDPSESARSSDLRTILFANFPVVDRKPMGGTLLRWLLQYRAGNFDKANPLHRAIADLLIFTERHMIETGQIRSDDLFFVVKYSSRL